MKANNKRGYFISIKEFKEINKSPFIATILSVFLGMLGVHRFYLKRKLTGIVFTLISVSSLVMGEGNLAAILIFISIIEGMIYMIKGIKLLKEKALNKKHINNKEIQQLTMIIDDEKDKTDIKQENIKDQIDDFEIIEVSNIETSKITIENKFDKNSKTDWIMKLNIPYERGIMSLYQIKEETLNLYGHLCDYIDNELKNDKGSLNKTIKKLESKNWYYGNILYTIYCISEGHVTKFYSGNDNYYNANFSYELLETHLGEHLKDQVFNKAKELEKEISFPNDETLKYFNLTDTGLKREWWDRDGYFRLEREFSKAELNILRVTPQRTTKVWELYKVNKQIIGLYLEIWEIISDSFEKDLVWKKKNKNILEKIKDGKIYYFADYDNGNILGSLIKISENAIRQVMPNTQILNVDKEKGNIKRYLPSKLTEDINNKIGEYTENITRENLKEILEEMSDNNPDDWKLKVKIILSEEDDKKIIRLINYKEDKNFIVMVKEILNNIKDEKLLLLCLYIIGRKEKLSQKNVRLLQDLINPSNISEYENIVQSEEVLSLEFSDRLLELKSPIRKTIELDMDKVKNSKEELNKTVDIIKEYIGHEEEVEIVDIEEEVVREKDNGKLKHKEFLSLILDSGSIDLEKSKKIAMDNGTLLNAFISEINQELYEYIQDQAIIVKDNYIKIDDFYVDMIKELLVNEK